MQQPGVASPERTNRRNGYRHRDFDTRAGTIDVAMTRATQQLVILTTP